MPQSSTASPAATQQALSADLDNACEQITAFRQRPLLVLYYPPPAPMTEQDLEDVYSAFRSSGVSPEDKLDSLDVLIESYGGDPTAGYRLAQLIRDCAREVNFLVPAHAYSAATILCFCGDAIRLGHLGGLSPIDLSLLYAASDQPSSEVELASLDSFLEFAIRARQKTEQVLKTLGSKNGTNIDSDLLVAMVQEIGALTVGKYFRERNVTRIYAEELLNRYMLPAHLDAQHRSKSLIHNFLFGSPSHQFHLDYHLCVKFGLVVHEMGNEEFDRTRTCLLELEKLAEQGIICQQVSPAYRLPFVRFYPVSAPSPATPETEIQPEAVESATVPSNGAAASPNGHSEAKTKETIHESRKKELEKAGT
jgi:hypothetical protein